MVRIGGSLGEGIGIVVCSISGPSALRAGVRPDRSYHLFGRHNGPAVECHKKAAEPPKICLHLWRDFDGAVVCGPEGSQQSSYKEPGWCDHLRQVVDYTYDAA